MTTETTLMNDLFKIFAVIAGFGVVLSLVVYLLYSNDLMLKSILDKNKRLECAITMPNNNGVDMNPDAKLD